MSHQHPFKAPAPITMKPAHISEGHQDFQPMKSPCFRKLSHFNPLISYHSSVWGPIPGMSTCIPTREFTFKHQNLQPVSAFFLCCLSHPRDNSCWWKIVPLFNCLFLEKRFPVWAFREYHVLEAAARKGDMGRYGCCCQYVSKHVLLITRTSSMCSKAPKYLLPPLHPDRFFPPPSYVTSTMSAWDSKCKKGVSLNQEAVWSGLSYLQTLKNRCCRQGRVTSAELLCEVTRKRPQTSLIYLNQV